MSVVRQAAAIPYRETDNGIEVLLVSRSKGGWGFPKGGIKKGHSAIRTASLETLEEAGVLGVIGEKAVGTYAYRKQGKRHEVKVFPLRVERMLGRWQEESRRLRVWVPIAEANRLLQKKQLEGLLVRLRHDLLTGGREPAPLLRLAA